MPGKRIRAEQYEKGIIAVINSPLRPLSDGELAEEMGVAYNTADRARAYINGVVERLGIAKDEKVAAQAAVARDLCIANAIKPATLAKSSTYQLMGAAEAADRIYRLASGKATQHIHHLHEITSREQVARRLIEAGILKDLGILDVVGTSLEAGHESEESEQNR